MADYLDYAIRLSVVLAGMSITALLLGVLLWENFEDWKIPAGKYFGAFGVLFAFFLLLALILIRIETELEY